MASSLVAVAVVPIAVDSCLVGVAVDPSLVGVAVNPFPVAVDPFLMTVDLFAVAGIPSVRPTGMETVFRALVQAGT